MQDLWLLKSEQMRSRPAEQVFFTILVKHLTRKWKDHILHLVLNMHASIKKTRKFFMRLRLTTVKLNVKRLLPALFRQLMQFQQQDRVQDERILKTISSVYSSLKIFQQALTVLKEHTLFRQAERFE